MNLERSKIKLTVLTTYHSMLQLLRTNLEKKMRSTMYQTQSIPHKESIINLYPKYTPLPLLNTPSLPHLSHAQIRGLAALVVQ